MDENQGITTPSEDSKESEWSAAWKAFNAATKKIGELARRDNVRVKLTLPTFGPKPKKRGSLSNKESR